MRKEIIDHFDKTWEEYDAWYDSHPALYQSELAALKPVVPSGSGLEIGAGTGRFATPLGVRFVLDPAIRMLRLAKKRGLQAVQGVGERIPFQDESFDFVQVVFVIEFVDNLSLFLKEAVRTIKRNGALILGFIDRDSPWGKYYARDPAHRRHFHPPSPEELVGIFEDVGLEFRKAFQTLFAPPPDLSQKEEPEPGFGRGGFVVLMAAKEHRGRSVSPGRNLGGMSSGRGSDD
jgi:SAM-dependent methyltransferase